jgi:hypothetical protein
MSDGLTWQKIDAVRREIERATPRGLVSPFQNLMAGMRVIEAPPPPPKVQAADIKFADGSSILDPAFRRSMNDWLTGRFGFQADPFKDTVYMFGDNVIMSPNNIALLRNLGP